MSVAAGEACTGAAGEDGIVLRKARADKESKYDELLGGGRCRLVVVGIETGGRWSEEAVSFVKSLAAVRAREAPDYLLTSEMWTWQRRLTRILGIACANAYACSLLSPVEGFDDIYIDGDVPDFADLFLSVGQVGADVGDVGVEGIV